MTVETYLPTHTIALVITYVVVSKYTYLPILFPQPNGERFFKVVIGTNNNNNTYWMDFIQTQVHKLERTHLDTGPLSRYAFPLKF